MLFNNVLLSCLLTFVTIKQAYGLQLREDVDDVFPSWSSYHHVAETALEKRRAEVPSLKPGQDATTPVHVNQAEAKTSEVAETGVIKQASEGNTEIKPAPALPSKPTVQPEAIPSNANSVPESVPNSNIGNASQNGNDTVISSTIAPVNITNVSNTTASKVPTYQPDLNNPGVMKRALIVFGAFALMAIAYFIFYRRKSKNNDSNNSHGTSDANQFRYGVLQSDERRDNLELSRIPLTMESDEDEDEDLEIFDLEQKKKSLSYVNLQTTDDYLVHGSSESVRYRDNLLLDIEDANSDTLINWSSNGNKSIL